MNAREESCLPYLGLLLTDLTFIDSNDDFIEARKAWRSVRRESRDLGDSKPEFTTGGDELLVNFAKARLSTNIILQLRRWLSTPYAKADSSLRRSLLVAIVQVIYFSLTNE